MRHPFFEFLFKSRGGQQHGENWFYWNGQHGKSNFARGIKRVSPDRFCIFGKDGGDKEEGFRRIRSSGCRFECGVRKPL